MLINSCSYYTSYPVRDDNSGTIVGVMVISKQLQLNTVHICTIEKKNKVNKTNIDVQ